MFNRLEDCFLRVSVKSYAELVIPIVHAVQVTKSHYCHGKSVNFMKINEHEGKENGKSIQRPHTKSIGFQPANTSTKSMSKRKQDLRGEKVILKLLLQ